MAGRKEANNKNSIMGEKNPSETNTVSEIAVPSASIELILEEEGFKSLDEYYEYLLFVSQEDTAR